MGNPVTMYIRSLFARHILHRLPESLAQHLRRTHYARLIRAHAEESIAEFKIIKELVRPGDFVLDVGANIGMFTKHLSLLVGDRGRVLSIEPMPWTFDVLRSNVGKLQLNNVDLTECAISDANGSVTMQVPRSGSMGENFYRASIVRNAADQSLRQANMESRTLDSLLSERMAEVSFIKCDVEGHELSCIKGAAGVIEAVHPAWFIEVSGDPDESGSTARATIELLMSAGYGVYWLDGDTLVERCTGDQSTDYFFLTRNHVRQLHERELISTCARRDKGQSTLPSPPLPTNSKKSW